MTPKISKRAEEHLKFNGAVGQGIETWTFMEGIIVEIAASLIGTSPEKAGLIFYSVMNFNVWLTVVTELFAMSPLLKGLASDWNSEAEKLKGLNDTRVRLTHHTVSDWGEEPVLKPHRFDSRPKSRKYKPLGYSEILLFSSDTLAVAIELRGIATRLEIAITQNVMGPQTASRDISGEPELDLKPPSGTPKSR